MKSYTRHLLVALLVLALAVVVVVALALMASSQEGKGGGVSVPLPSASPAPGIAPLTADENESIRLAQLEVRDAASEYAKLKADTEAQLLQTLQYRRQQDALAHLQNTINLVFDVRKLKSEKDASLCDGPDQRPACADMIGRKLEIRPVPTPKAK